jgi:hypothetical protein
MQQRLRRHLAVAGRPVVSRALVTMFLAQFSLYAPAQVGLPKTGAQCLPPLGNGNICTAKDLDVRATRVSGPTSCTAGEIIDVELDFVISRNANFSTRAASQRYTLGFFLGENGEPALNGASCTFSSLQPLAPPLDLAGGSGGYRDLNADACGDIDSNDITVHRFSSNQVFCEDTNGDGLLDVDFAIAWNNNQNVQCTDPTDETEFYPAQSSRCILNPDYEIDIGVEQPPAISVVKSAIPEEVREPGGSVVYRVTVVNESGERDPVTLTSLDDDIYGNLDGRGNCTLPQSIPPGAGYTCEFTETVSGPQGSAVTDVITAQGQDDEGNPVTGSDDATVTIIAAAAPVPPPNIEVSKTAQPSSVPEPGSPVDYTITVLNKGTQAVELTNLVDSLYPGGDLNGVGNCAIPAPIPPGASYQCDARIDITGQPGDSVVNTATATVRDVDSGIQRQDQDTATVVITDAPSRILVRKVPTPCCLAAPGGNVSYAVRVTNLSLADTVVVDSLVDNLHDNLDGQGSCAVPFTLAPSDRYECSFTAAVTGVAGDVVPDTITASGADDDGAAVTGTGGAEVLIEAAGGPGSISVIKGADPTSLTAPGGAVTFSVEVFNTSEADIITLTNLIDDVHGPLDGQGDCSVPQTIAIGASYSCSFSAGVTGIGGDVETDTIIASGTDEGGDLVSAEDSATVNILSDPPQILVRKRANPFITAPGSNVTFSVRVTNASVAATLVLTTLEDDRYGNLDGQGSCNLPQTLGAGATYDCQFSGIVNGPSPGLHRNTVVATAVQSLARAANRSFISDQDSAFVIL